MNSDKDIPLLSSIYKSKHTGRASASTRKKGSITVEAAMAVPIFFFATLALVLLLELLSVQTAVRSGLQEAGKKLAVQAVEVPAVIPSNLERDVVNSIGAERLERSIVEGGSSGINCNQSYLSPFTGIGEIQASYQVRIPVPGFSIAPISYKETFDLRCDRRVCAGICIVSDCICNGYRSCLSQKSTLYASGPVDPYGGVIGT